MSIDKGALYVVATPIGNLGDISPRAIEVLSGVDMIAAEDTRQSRKLLQHCAINTRCIAYHEHNERELCARLVEQLLGGQAIALISDAGTPLISDPGYHLVRAAHAAHCRVIPIPGPSAMISALSVSGLPTDRFVFEGFLPSRASARRQRLEQLVEENRTLVFFESTHRVIEMLGDLVVVFGATREAVVARELTKMFETVRHDTLGDLHEWMVADPHQHKGELVIIVQGAEAISSSTVLADNENRRVLGHLLEELPLKQAVKIAARLTGAKRNHLYEMAVTLQGGKSDQPGL